jgi:ubiquitin carboxyl-terminal hydrolase 7
MTNLLRKATYKIPTENDNPNDSIPLALQRVFYRLQTSDSPVGTTELTKSFGWDSMESFMQHDVHEFNRVLMDELENKMKKTEVEGMVEKIFTGKVKHVRKCLNVPFESNREETFYDVQLTIKGVKSLEESFKLYVKPEMLQGDNKYRTDEFGLQDAKMYCIFEKFPPVLHLHLERYTFDPNTFNTIKINDYFEFPERINLDNFLSETADKSVPQDFVLHSVLVHGGDSHGGHYNVFINRDGKWYKFDDTRVVQVTKREAIQDNYGYTEDSDVIEMDSAPVYPKLPSYNRLQRYRKMTNAYMLVYIREADWDLIMSPVTDVDIPEYISKRIKADEEVELLRRLERQETMMAVHVSLFTDEELQKYCGPDFFNVQKKAFPITGYESLRMRRDNTIAEVKDIIAEEMNLPPGSFRLWSFAIRRNGTTRLDIPLESDEKSLYTYTGTGQLSNQVFLYLEKAKICDENGTPIFPENSPGTAFVTFKYFNRDTGTLHHLTSMTVTKDTPIEPYIRQLCDDYYLMESSFPFEVFEEIKLMRLDTVVPSKTFDACSIGTGDILLIQRASMADEVLPGVVDFFADMADSILLVLKPMDETVGRKRSSDDIPVEENIEDIEFVYKTKGSLGYVLELIGQKINVDPKYIRLHWLDPRTERYWILKNLGTEDISVEKAIEAAVYPATQPLNVQSKLVFSFEVLSMAVDELDSMKHISVHLSGFKDVDINEKHDLYIPFHANLRDMLKLLPTSVQDHLSAEDCYRLFEVGSHRITRDYGMEDLLASIPDGNSVYLQKIEPLGEGDLIVGCFFYHREPVRTHSMPFIFFLRASEPFWETKRRLQEFLGADDGLKISIIAFGRPKDIEETQALSIILDVVSGTKRVVYHQSIGIDIPDPSQEEAIQKAKSVGSERSIKIRSSTPSNQK